MTAKANETLKARLRGFIDEHPRGWGHDEWQALLGRLESDGHDVADPEAIGGELERIRLRVRLEEMDVKGVGPKRKEALVRHFGSLWGVHQASVEELASVPALNKKVAETLHEALH